MHLPARTALLAAVALAAPVHAVDGVVEINQALAIVGGVTPGDTPGFPVTLSRSGSYRLTDNLDLRDSANPSNLTAIEITADDVTVDLNGFTIRGPTVCTGSPPAQALVCSPVGSGRGVATSGTRRAIRIGNGIIDGAGGDGILCGDGCQVERITVRHNGNRGLRLGEGGMIRECHAERNRFEGFSASPGVVIERSTAVRNGGTGIATSGHGLVLNNIASSNFDFGLAATLTGGTMAAFVGNVFTANGPNGTSNQTVGGVQIGSNYCGSNTTCP